MLEISKCNFVGNWNLRLIGCAYHVEWSISDEFKVLLYCWPWQVTPLQLATVYSTIASGGVYHKPYLITRINAHDGRVLEEVKVGASFSLLCAVVQRATYSTRICLMWMLVDLWLELMFRSPVSALCSSLHKVFWASFHQILEFLLIVSIFVESGHQLKVLSVGMRLHIFALYIP
jgi:hypothetical protein